MVGVGFLLGAKVIRIGSIVFFIASGALFLYFLIQSYLNSWQTCEIADGCMNEFGGFILFPLSCLGIAVLLWIIGRYRARDLR
ncbi:MAG: hypothetical protein MZU97_21905 [Bacillus subtilis]|nr:hypothetical protein [Bacillus subtilis]